MIDFISGYLYYQIYSSAVWKKGDTLKTTFMSLYSI